MPKKPKQKKVTTTVVVNGVPIAVTLHPPTVTRKSWYAYWSGLTYTKSTGCADLEDAFVAVQRMVTNGGQKPSVKETLLSDDEFDQIQHRHFSKKNDPAARKRAEKSLTACMEAITAFREISGLSPVTRATPDDCERFQHDALTMSKNWRSKYPNSREDADTLSPNTVIKWSVALRAAFERANRNAGRKCVRGVVPEEKLLSSNPWTKFTWIEGREKKIRQFDPQELVSFLDHLETKWRGVTVATALAKVCLWSWGRRSEVVGLRWDNLRLVGDEVHFESIGKWAVDKWFRIPQALYREIAALRTESPFVFAAYIGQLREFHQRGDQSWLAQRVNAEFSPKNLGDWFYGRVREWSKSSPGGLACIHVFRKTSLQYARSGEDVNRLVAHDARLGESVMMTSYVKETDEAMRQKSNRTFFRILRSLPRDVAVRFGSEDSAADRLVEQLDRARANGDWRLVGVLAQQMAAMETKPS